MPLLPGVLEHVERHHRVLERPVWLPDELVHLCVGGQMHDEIRLRVLDAVDPARERRVVRRRGPGAGTGSRPSTCSGACRRRRRRGRPAAVDARDSCRSAPTTRSPGLSLPATAVRWAPRSVVEVAPAIRTSASSPGTASPVKFDHRVAARASAQQARVGSAPALDEHLLRSFRRARRFARTRSAARRRPAVRAARA